MSLTKKTPLSNFRQNLNGPQKYDKVFSLIGNQENTNENLFCTHKTSNI